MEFYYHESEKDVLIVSADGGINKQTSRQFTESVIDLIDGGLTKIIVDCDKLTYISSYGLGALLRLHKRAKAAGGEVKVANVHSMVVEVLKLTHVNRLFGIYADVNKARLAFKPVA